MGRLKSKGGPKLVKNLCESHTNEAVKRKSSSPLDLPNEKKLKIAPLDSKKQPPKIEESCLFMDTMLNVLNSAQKVIKRRKHKPETPKKVTEPMSPVAPSLSPSIPLLHTPSMVDLDYLSCIMPNVDKALSFSEPTVPSNYEMTNEKPIINEEPIVEKPPQLNFYRETLFDSTTESLNTDENKANIGGSSSVNGLKSAIVYARSKSSKKTVSWKDESDLVQVTYFEHDENERVNVNKTFKHTKMHKLQTARQNIIAVRKLKTADNMKPKTVWRCLDDKLLIDIPEVPGKQKIEPGSGSFEKMKQSLREHTVLQDIYFTRNMIPDSPEEPDEIGIKPYSGPMIIPLKNISADSELMYNYVKIPWPKPKGEQPSLVEFPVGMNNIRTIPNINIKQRRFTVYSGNQNNCVMPPDYFMRNVPPKTNIYKMPSNQKLLHNQMFMGEQIPPQPQCLPLQPQQQQLPPKQYVQDVQWMGPPGPPMHHVQQHLPTINGPPHFDRSGGYGVRSHSRLPNNYSVFNHNTYRGQINRVSQLGNRSSAFNFRGENLANRRKIRLCKYYARQGFCNTFNCAFLHLNSQ